jgi:hypothetical protein
VVTAPPPPDAEALAGAPAPVPAAPADASAAVAETEEEEEALLKRRDPDAEKEVIVDDTPAVRHPARPSSTGSKPTEPPPVVSVSVLISTVPQGAVIRMKNRVFGRAPMNLRFRPGVPFDLSFVKSGYVTRTRRFTFANKKNQTVKVTLARRPEKKKGFFRRLFGG